MAATTLKNLSYLSLIISVSGLLPSGKNVCLVNESYTTTVRVEEPYQYRRRTSVWCFSVPPRCSKYETAWSWRWVDKEVEETRIVPKCCQGYVAGRYDVDCQPFCSKPCKHGLCSNPDVCQCEAGFQGKTCEASCQRGMWGVNCSQSCDCKNGAFCEPIQGNCHCSAGWLAKKCDVPCPEGFYGPECLQKCQCGDFVSCHHITGDCIYPTTVTVETTSATEPITTSTEEISTTTFQLTTELTTETSTTEESTFTPEVSTSITGESSSPTKELTSTISEPTTTTDLSTISIEFSTTSEATIPSVTVLSKESIFLSTEVITESTNNLFEETPVESEGEISNSPELAGLVVTIVLSVIGAIILLIAAAGIALTKHRKKVQLQIASTDLGIHKFYGEINVPVKAIFNNPTYNCDLRCEKPVLRTFTPTQDTFDAELREILEAHYDHPPTIVGQLTLSVEHLYDEISATYDEAREITAFRTFS